jgi:hypothetical protein
LKGFGTDTAQFQTGWFLESSRREVGFVPLSGSLLAAMAAVTVAYLSAAEVAKHFAIARNS